MPAYGEVAAEISKRYAGRTLTLIGVLKGSVFFLTALARHIEVPVKMDFPGDLEFLQQERIARRGAHRQGSGRKHRRRGRAAGGGYRRYRLHAALSAADAGRPGAELALGLHLPGSQLAAHRAGAGGLIAASRSPTASW